MEAKASKEKPFFAFLFFVFIYISILYSCSLSPSSLLLNSKFWFFISNTLILIIAADYGAFSPPKQKLGYLRQEYDQTHIQTTLFVSENTEKIPSREFEEKENPEADLLKTFTKTYPENPKEDSPENDTLFSEKTTKNQEIAVEESKPKKLEQAKRMEEEADQFSKLTDEELNERVEEFIQKFNKHIRLQRIHENLAKARTV